MDAGVGFSKWISLSGGLAICLVLPSQADVRPKAASAPGPAC
jgi:hypothetical protein